MIDLQYKGNKHPQGCNSEEFCLIFMEPNKCQVKITFFTMRDNFHDFRHKNVPHRDGYGDYTVHRDCRQVF